MNFDWTKPLLIDWTGRSGPLISEEDIKSSVIHRILRNQFQAPFCGREIVRATPWWSPRDPFRTNSENSLTGKRRRFIPGLHHPPVYPQLSTLSRQQHQQGLRVLAAAHDVQPRDYPQPTQKDYHLFEEIKELYEKEQKEYIKWAKQTWINGDCIRALRPKPTIEQVYEAEFKMRAYEAQSLPQNYTLAAQIPLETKTQAFEFEHKQDLLNVDIEDLPNVEYPEEMHSDFSILKPCPLPEPCAEHPCKFVLPYESSVSNQPLAEVNYELAQYAIGNGVSFVTSENALHCLLETERSWCIPVSVVELVGPDGDVRTVTVLGSEFGAQKECATQRTYKAYKHLLQHRFAPSNGHYKKKKSTQQTVKSPSHSFIEEPIAQPLNHFESLDDDSAVSSDDDSKLQIDDHKPNVYGEVNECDGEPGSEPDRLMIYDNDVNITELYDNQDSYKPNYSKNTEARPSYSYDESTNEEDPLLTDENVVHTEPCNNAEARPSYSSDARCTEHHRDMIDNNKVNNQAHFYNKDSYEPEYSNDFKIRPSYSRSEPISQPDRLMIDDNNVTDRVPVYNKGPYEPESNHESSSEPDRLASNNLTDLKLFEANKLADPRLLETNKDADPKFFDTSKDASTSLFETNEDAATCLFETNKDAATSLFETNKDAASNLFETNKDAATNLFETKEDAASSLFETNKDAATYLLEKKEDAATSLFETNKDAATNLFKTNKDAATNLLETKEDAATSLFETNKDAATSLFETNEDAATSLFETNEDAATCLFDTDKNAEPKLFEMNEDYNPRLLDMSEDYDPRFFYMNEEAASSFFATNINEPTTQTKTSALPKFNSNKPVTSEVSSQNNSILSPNQLSPIKQCKVSVRNLPIESIASSKATVSRTVSVQQLNFESCSGKHNVSVNNTEIINDHVEDISEVSIKIPLKTYSRSKNKNRSISGTSNVFDQANQKPSTSRNDAKCHVEVIKPITTKKTTEVTPTQLSPLKPCIKKPVTSPRKNSPRKLFFSESITSILTYETDANSSQANNSEINRSDVDKPRNVRSRRLSGLIYEEHGYCINQADNLRTIEKQSKTSYEGSNRSQLSSVKLSVDDTIDKSNYDKSKEPGVSRLRFNEAIPTTHETKIEINDTSFNRKQDIEDCGLNNSTKTNRGKMSIRELFGDESDSDEPIYNIAKRCIAFNKAICDNNREESASSAVKMLDSNNAPSIKDIDSNEDFTEPKNSSYIDPVSDKLGSIKKSSLKTILRKPSFSDSSPKNSKRKLSFSDPLTSDPELMSFSEPDNEDDIVGFVNGVAVPLNQPKNNQKETVICTYSLPSRSRPKAKPATAAKKSKTTKSLKENCGFTKITLSKPNKQNENFESSNIGKTKQLTKTKNDSERKSRRISACSYNDSDDSDSSRYSGRISAVSNIGKPNMTHKQTETVKVGLKRNRRISSRSYSDESDAPYFSQRSHISKVTRKTSSLRKSQRISSRLDAEEGHSRINKTKINNTDGLRRSPRLSTSSTKENVPEDSDDSQINKTKINNTDGLRRSHRLSTYTTRENAPEDSDDSRMNKTKINKTDGLRRPRRLSTYSTKENAPEDSDDSQINKTKNNNTDGLRRSRRLSTGSTKENALEGCNDSRINKTKINNTDGLRRSRRLSTYSTKENAPKDSDDSRINKININNADGLRRSSRLSTYSTKENAPEDSDDSQINKTKINNTDGLRRSSRLSTYSTKENAPEDSDDSQINKTKINNTDGLRRSRRLSAYSTKENVPPKTSQRKTNENSLFLNTANTIKKHENRRKSLPANIFSNTDKLKKVIRSKSVTNLYEIVKIKKVLRSGSKIDSNSTNFLNTRDMDISLELSERTKRFLRRSFNIVNSKTNQPKGEMSERTKKYTCRSKSSAYSEAKISDTELKKRSKKYTHHTNFTSSHYARNSKNSKTGASTIESMHGDTTERTKRHVSRSTSSAYSSCDETDQPLSIRRKGTKRQPKNMNIQIDRIINTMDSLSAMKTNQMNQLNTIQFKTEAMYTADQVESTIHNMGQSLDESKIEIDEIEIKLYEVPNENIDETETFETSQGTEPNLDTCEESSLLTEEELFGNHQNTGNEIEEFNILHFKASTETDVSGTESSDSENEMYICHSNTFESLNNLTKNAMNETKDMEYVETEIEESKTSHFSITNKIEDRSQITEESRPRTADVFFESADNGMEDKDQTISNKVNQPVDPILTDPNETIRSRKLSISEISDSSDYYFDTNDAEELNMFHFTVTNNTDSEEESNWTSEDIDPPVASRTEEEKIKNNNKTNNTLNKTNDVINEISQNVFPSTSSGDRVSNYETLDTAALSMETVNGIIGVRNCTCKGTMFEVPPPRSFKKWQLRNITSNVNFNIIVHSSHKLRKDTSEMLLEPIVEYQPELGGAKQSAGKLRALALALMLRKSAELINVRIDHDNGNVIVVDRMSSKQFVERHGDRRGDVADCLHTAINQLRYLMPGQYVLTHDSRHGANAMLYTTKGVHCAGAPHTLSLRQDSINMPDADEVIHAKIPPELGPALLPYHKHRSTLPLAFTPFKSQVREERRADAALPKAKHPPSAIQWPKKKKKKKTRQRQSARLAPSRLPAPGRLVRLRPYQ